MNKRLIEEWLPIAELSEESVRERRSMTALPPIYYLHVWWARRPLVASRAAVLASLLPADADRKKFMHAIGIHGDPVAARRKIDIARQKGERFKGEAYSYPRAFLYNLSDTDRQWITTEQKKLGLKHPSILDPTAGGGSIPFEALRLGCEVYANDLNPVAVVVQKATYEWPSLYGLPILSEFNRLKDEFLKRREKRLSSFFASEPESTAISTNFLWARTVVCPYCDGVVPLSPNWKLAPEGTGIKLKPKLGDGPGTKGRVCCFEIVQNLDDHSPGTVTRGKGTCPYSDCNRVIEDKLIRQQACDGLMGEQLFAIVYKQKIVVTSPKTGRTREKWERRYRTPRPEDDVSAYCQENLEAKILDWEAFNFLPSEKIESAHEKYDPRRWGIYNWQDFFSPRQLLCHGTSVEIFHELFLEEKTKEEFSDSVRAALACLGLSLDKLRDYNSRMTRWHSTRQVTVNTFDRHDFSFKWSYAEMSPLTVGLGYDWAFNQTAKCIKELLGLTFPESLINQDDLPLFQGISQPSQASSPTVTLTCQSGDELNYLADNSIDAVILDPPYYDNVMYAELSDFFYVWLKRTVGHLYPELFTRQLTDKDNEAVANAAKFKGQKGAKELAAKDYQEHMTSIFAECQRVLKSDGIMTLMFTHKATGAWDALTKGLIEAGFVITASWPINTEASGSLHIKDKSAANSTIFLVCRPRTQSSNSKVVFWEDLEPIVAKAIREHISEFLEAGISGVDLYLSCFGPALEEFSRHWPVKRGQPKVQTVASKKRKETVTDEDPYSVTPEDALEAARREVKYWKLEQLTNAQRIHELDPLTEWFVLAWDAFQAPKFPYDESLRLARVVGLDMDRDVIKVLAEKKSSNVILWDSGTRAAKGTLGSPDGRRSLIDAIHHAAYLGRTQSLEAAQELLETNSLSNEPRFLAALEAVLEVLPPSKSYTGFDPTKASIPAANDFEVLENLRRLAFTAQIDEPNQLALWAEETS